MVISAIAYAQSEAAGTPPVLLLPAVGEHVKVSGL